MDRLSIAATLSTPQIECDPALGRVRIGGESYPENTAEFYRPLLAWVRKHLAGGRGIEVDFALIYLNTSSVKVMLDLLELLDDAYRQGQPVRVNWHYDAENPRALELAEEFQEDLGLRFNLLAGPGP
jgi:hypothetical protein